ncbi:MAG: DivIVA domain-containing protein [Clostridia bacterium]|nr:DivIVA domain-containing protein [Clostridia bacterium]
MLTIEDIEDVSFRKSGFSGYKTDDVDNFVDGVIEKVRDLQLTNKELQARVDQLSKKVFKYEQQANTVQDAIITAERTAKTIVREAELKAEAMLKDAQAKSDEMIRNAEEAACMRTNESEIRAQTILDNALSRSASSIDENNRIIEQQKQNIIRIQSEVTRFREALIDSYKNHLRIINSLPKEEEFRQYQANLDEAYPAASPVRPDSLEQEIRDEADKAVEQAKIDGPHITVSVLDADKVKEIAEELRTNSKVQAELERDQEADRRVHEISDADVDEGEPETAVSEFDEPEDDTEDQTTDESVIMFKKISPTQKEMPDSNTDDIIAAANAAASKRNDEPMPTSIDEIGDGAIFGSDDTLGENSRQPISLDEENDDDASQTENNE